LYLENFTDSFFRSLLSFWHTRSTNLPPK
jgi:hypothetical protein